MPEQQHTQAIKPFLISNEHLEWIFKSLAALVIPTLYYIIQINGNYTELQTKVQQIEKMREEDSLKLNEMSKKINESSVDTAEIKVSISFIAKTIADLKSDNTSKFLEIKSDLKDLNNRLTPISVPYQPTTFTTNGK